VGLLDDIYRLTHQTVAPTPVAPPVTGIDPATGRAYEAPLVAPATPLIVPAPKDAGILKAVGSFFAPEAGSFWASAMTNPDGVFGAKQAQQAYADKRAQLPIAQRAAITKEAADEQQVESDRQTLTDPTRRDRAVGGSIARPTATGDYKTIYTPPPVQTQPTEQERLIDRWQKTPEGPLKTLLERAIRGFQYTPEVIAAQTEGKLRVKRATPGKAPSSGGGGSKVTATARAKYLAEADAAIAKGADPAKVHARLKTMGVE
jgi:hypothetical protein